MSNRIRSAASAFVSTAIPSTFQLRSSSASVASRAACAALRAICSVPPLTIPASMPSRAATSITSSTESFSACCQATTAVTTVQLRHLLRSPGNQPRQPAAVAAGRAEPGEPGLQDRDPQRRVRALEVVRGPQPGVAGTDDAHVGVAVARQRRPVHGQSVVPVRDLTVDRYLVNAE